MVGQGTKYSQKTIDIPAMRTMYSRTSANNDGTFTNTTYSHPIHYMKNGDWHPIDLSIQSNDDQNRDSYSMVNATNNFKTYFPSHINEGLFCQLSADSYIKDMLSAKMYFESNGAILSSQSMHSISPIVTGNKVSYVNVYQGVDLEVSINESRRKADYIIRSSEYLNQIPESAEFLVFEELIKLPKDWSAMLRNGRVDLLNSNGDIKASYDTPLLKDANHGSLPINQNPKFQDKENTKNIFSNMKLALPF